MPGLEKSQCQNIYHLRRMQVQARTGLHFPLVDLWLIWLSVERPVKNCTDCTYHYENMPIQIY